MTSLRVCLGMKVDDMRVIRYYTELVIESMQGNEFDLFDDSPATSTYKIRKWSKKVAGFLATKREIDEIVRFVRFELEKDYGVRVVDLDVN